MPIIQKGAAAVKQARRRPEWEERWQQSAARWPGALAFVIGDERFALELSSVGIRLLERMPAQPATVALTPQAFTQLLFGYRPITWTLQQSGQSLPDELLLTLKTLFPPVQTWIAGSDDF